MKREARIGVFAIVMLGCLWGGIRFLSGFDIFSRNVEYRAIYDRIDGIQNATPVTIQGVKVGAVTAVTFDPSVSRDVALELTVKRQYRIPRNSTARIYSDGIMGGKAIAIVLGDSPEYLGKGDTLRSERSADLMEFAGEELGDLSTRITRVMESLTATLDGLNDLLSANRANIDGTLSHLNSVTGNLDGLLADERGDLQRAIAGFGSFAESLGRNAGHVDSLMGHLDAFSAQLAEARLDSLAQGLQRTLAAVNATLEGIDRGEGTLGKLVKDPALYDSLNRAGGSLAALLEDLKANPKRYVHFSIFGSKDPVAKERAKAEKEARKAAEKAAREAEKAARE